MQDNVGLHFSAGLGAGLAATILGSPWDVIGTRLMARTPVPGAHDLLPRAKSRSRRFVCINVYRLPSRC